MGKRIAFAQASLPPRSLPLFLAVLLQVGLAAAAPAQPLTMTAGFQVSPTYRTNCWQPIRLEFRNEGPAAVEGSAIVPLADPQAPAAMTLPLTLPPGSLVRATV